MISSVLLIAAICLTIGYVVGWLLSTLRADKHAPKHSRAAESVDASRPNQKNLLRVSREITSGDLTVEIRGNRVADASGLNLETRQELANLLKDIGSWMGLPVETAPLPRSAGVDRSGLPLTVEGSSLGESGLSDLEQLRPSLIGGMTTAIADVVSPVQPARRDVPKSIVQQIDEILQEKLRGTPYEGEKIYVTEDIRKGVLVWVGSVMYEGVGAMPEGDIKNLLRESVKEWERLQELARRRNEKK